VSEANYLNVVLCIYSENSVWLDDRFSVPTGKMNRSFHFTTAFRLAPGLIQPPIQWLPGALSPETKRSGREANRLLLSCAKAKNTLSYNFTHYTSS